MSKLRNTTIVALILSILFLLCPKTYAQGELPRPQLPSVAMCNNAQEASNPFSMFFVSAIAKAEPRAVTQGSSTQAFDIEIRFTYDSSFEEYKKAIKASKIYAGTVNILKNGTTKKTYPSKISNYHFDYKSSESVSSATTISYDIQQKICWSTGGKNYYAIIKAASPVKITLAPSQQPVISQPENTSPAVSSSDSGFSRCMADNKQGCDQCCAGSKTIIGTPTMAYVTCFMVCTVDKAIVGYFGWFLNIAIYVLNVSLGLM